MNKHVNIRTFTLIGVFANICFILFILLGFLYYWLWSSSGRRYSIGDIGIYPFEILGFVLLAVYTAAYVICLTEHRLLKILMIVYFITELTLILLEFGLIFPTSSYDNDSWFVIITNFIITLPICIGYQTLAPLNLRLRRAVIITAAIIVLSFFAFGLAFSFTVYYSILANCIGYLYLNLFTFNQMNKGNITVEERKLFPDR